MEKKARLLNMQVNLDEFIPATEEEKEYMVQMRPSTTFFKDGMKRLVKNRIAFASLIVIVIITLASILIPFFWPYKYDTMLGVRPGKPVDSSYNNLAPFHYGKTELKKIDAGEKDSPTSSAPIPPDGIISSVWFTALGFPWPSASLPASSC